MNLQSQRPLLATAVLRSLSLLVTLLVLLVLLVSPAWALTTGQLRVVVTDNTPDELPILGVLFRLSGETLIGGAQEGTGDDNGEVLFTELPPGLYKVEVTRAGFDGVTVDKIMVNINRTTVQSVKLRAGAGEMATVIANQRSVSASDTRPEHRISRDFLKPIPCGDARDAHTQIQENPGQLRVVVTDNTSEHLPIAGANVTLSGVGGCAQSISQSTGEALFSGLSPGWYQSVITKDGFGTINVGGLLVEKDRTTTRWFELSALLSPSFLESLGSIAQPLLRCLERATSEWRAESYGLARAKLVCGQLPDPDEVRVEAFVNAFERPMSLPQDGEPLVVHLQAAPHPLHPHHVVLAVTLRSQPMEVAWLLAFRATLEVSFPSSSVLSWRPIGNHEVRIEALNTWAGGYQSTMLYELVVKHNPKGDLARVHLSDRYLKAVEFDTTFEASEVAKTFASASSDLRFATGVAVFAELLRHSPQVAEASFADVLEILDSAIDSSDADQRELRNLVIHAAELLAADLPSAP